MPTITQNLKLVTENSTSDGQRKFLTHRMDLSGNVDSSLTKIDTWAGIVNDKLVNLEKVKPSILVEASWISTGYYEATVLDINLYKLGDIITFKPNKNNDGTTMLKINTLEAKFLMKYDMNGNQSNLEDGDLRINHEYQFRYEGTNWVWQNGNSSDQINIIGLSDNLTAIGEDSNICDSGISKTQITSNATNIGDLSLLTTEVKDNLVNASNELNDKKIDKTQITTSLTEVVEGKIADATVLKILNDNINTRALKTDVGELEQLTTSSKNNVVAAINETKDEITVLSNDRGYENGKLINEISTAHGINGLYWNEINNKEAPTNDMYSILSMGRNATMSNLFAIRFANNSGFTIEPQAYIKSKKGGWKQLATTDKIDISLLNGWEQYGTYSIAKAINTGGEVILSGVIRFGVITSGTIIGTLPIGFRPKYTEICYVNFGDKAYRIDIKNSGNITLATDLPSNAYLSLNSVKFSLN